MEILIHSEEEMLKLGAALASILDDGDVVYLLGELGVGKTTLARGMVKSLGYAGHVTSPTFTIMNIYSSRPPVYHFDFYRLQSGEIEDLGLEDYLQRPGISIIEWPQAGEELLPREGIQVEINLCENDYERERIVRIGAQGPEYIQKLERLMSIVHSSH